MLRFQKGTYLAIWSQLPNRTRYDNAFTAWLDHKSKSVTVQTLCTLQNFLVESLINLRFFSFQLKPIERYAVKFLETLYEPDRLDEVQQTEVSNSLLD